MRQHLQGCRRIIISQDNLKLLGTRYSYVEYEKFFEESLAPLQISDEELLTIPETIEQRSPEDDEEDSQDEGHGAEDDWLPGVSGNGANENNGGGFDFDEDFYR